MASTSPIGGVGGELRRDLRLHQAVALGVGGTIGGGIFVLVGAGAGLAGPAVTLAFVLAFAASLTIALPYAELACRYPVAGGGYAFARAVLGQRWGFATGWAFWGAYVFISGYVTLGFGGHLAALTGLPRVVGAVALIAVATAMNLLGIQLSGRVQAAVVLLGVAALLAFALAGLGHLQAHNLHPFAPRGASGIAAAVLLAFLAFGGFDMVAAAGEEVTNPERNLPRAIVLTLLAVLGLYLLVAVAAVGVVPWQELGASAAPLAGAAASFLGPQGRLLIAIAALLSTAATSNAVLVVTSRISFALARDRFLPRQLAFVHPATGVPVVAVLANGGLLSLVALAGSVRLAVSVGGFLYVLHFLAAPAALVRLRRRRVGRPSFRTPLAPVVLPLAVAACLALLCTSGTTGVAGGAAWLLLGLLAYRPSRARTP